MQGRRVETLAEFYDPERRQPGDYCKVLPYSEDNEDGIGSKVTWYVCDPNGQVGRLVDHIITEHEDGTITVSPSILDAPGGWHGYLERGVWRSV